MPAPICVRLSAPADLRLRERFDLLGMTPSGGLRMLVDEWLAMADQGSIEFRDGAFGRRAAVRGGPEVWEIVVAASAYEDDRAGLEAHFGWLEPAKIEEALKYYESRREEIDGLLAEIERVIARSAAPGRTAQR